MIPPARPASAPLPAPRFAALHTRDYRRYFALSLTAMTADNIEHVISYWVIYQPFQHGDARLRAGSGLTVGVLGALINVQWSLALSARVVVVNAAVLFAHETGRVASDTGFTR